VDSGDSPVTDASTLAGAATGGVHNFADAVRRAAARAGDAPALVTADAAVSWVELDREVDRVAAGLISLDLPPAGGARARVAVVLPNVREFASSYFGALRAGLVCVPTNPDYTARELLHQLDDCGAGAIIATDEVLARMAAVRDGLPALRHTFSTGGQEAAPFGHLARDSGPITPTIGAEDLAVLLYTSGTAGLPKGAMLTHRALAANNRQIAQLDPPIITRDDVVLLALPLFHAFGLNSGLGAVAWHGACGILAPRFEAELTAQLVARHRVSVIAAVPQMYQAWAELPEVGEAFSSVRVAVSGAAPLEAVTARRFAAVSGTRVFQGYGLTETAPVLTTAVASPGKDGSIGRPVPEVEIVLVAADGARIAQVSPSGLTGTDRGAGDFDDDAGGVPGTDPGEIVARGPNLFSGYWPNGTGGPDAEGWWATGDVAYADPDGDLFLVDRLGELILVSGFNVYPHEVELVIEAHPGVREAAVVPIADERTGQAVKAFVVGEPAAAVTADEIMAHCRRNLARFKCPSAIEFVTELPHTAIGKVRKNVLQAHP
jgi:long-chain acyl-CoA synthetase